MAAAIRKLPPDEAQRAFPQRARAVRRRERGEGRPRRTPSPWTWTQTAWPTVLLVDGDPQLATMLADALSARHYRVHHAGSAAEATALVDELRPALIVMDLVFPDEDGLVLCADLKARTGAPIIIYSGSKRRGDAVLGLKLGADDFLAKPVSLDELEIRMDRVLQRPAPQTAAHAHRHPSVQQIGDLVIDRTSCEVRLRGRVLQLTPTEYRLLCQVASRPGEVLSGGELAESVWGSPNPRVAQSLGVHMRRVRAKLGAGAATRPQLVTRRGLGYQLVTDNQPSSAV